MTVAPVSVVIPALNAERFIAEAIKSVHAQTLGVTEIVVVDNGSTDQSAQIAGELGAQIVAEPQRGLSRARNAGIRNSTQPWVALLDADDLWDPDKMELQWAAIQSHPDAGLVASYFRLITDGVVTLENTDAESVKRWDGYNGRQVDSDCSYFSKAEFDFFPRFLPSCSDAVIRRDVFAEVGLFDETVLYNEDFEFFMRVLARYPLAVIEKPLISCRRHDQKHSANWQGMREANFAIVNHMLKHPEKYPAGGPEVFRDRLKKNFLTVERALQEKRASNQSMTGEPTESNAD
ncbi:MAG TPA: glycosyltransferase family A protein [Pyrinomonadaceae bacterium]|nr:glycosyltransferase family A protein [Pyrinomonadaceae bacterium]